MDRDGTIIKDLGYISKPRDVKLIPGARKGMELLSGIDAKIFLVTNQSGIARGLYSIADFNRVNKYMYKLLGSKVRIDGVYLCPHFAQGNVKRYAIECNCRKPAPGLIAKAAAAYDIDLKNSFIVGDKMRDVAAGWKMGVRTVLVLSGVTKKKMLLRKLPGSFDIRILKLACKGFIKEKEIIGPVDYVAKNLLVATKWIMKQVVKV